MKNKKSIYNTPYCIHLKTRKDREENMYKELNYFSPNNYEIVDGRLDRIGKIGVIYSFRKAIKMALQKDPNVEAILIFEDDVQFTSEKSREVWDICVDNLPSDWDILLGGVYWGDLIDIGNDYIKRVENFSSLHCTLIRNTLFDHILNYKIDDIRTLHLDRYFGVLAKNKEINAYVCSPFIAIQYPGKSNTVNKQVDYSKYLEKFDILR